MRCIGSRCTSVTNLNFGGLEGYAYVGHVPVDGILVRGVGQLMGQRISTVTSACMHRPSERVSSLEPCLRHSLAFICPVAGLAAS